MGQIAWLSDSNDELSPASFVCEIHARGMSIRFSIREDLAFLLSSVIVPILRRVFPGVSILFLIKTTWLADSKLFTGSLQRRVIVPKFRLQCSVYWLNVPGVEEDTIMV